MSKSDNEHQLGVLSQPTVQFALATAVLLTAAVMIPAFPDELARIELARTLIATGSYNFFWPPLTVLLPAMNPMLDFGYIPVRILQLALAMPVIYFLAEMKKSVIQAALLVLVLPYLSLILSTSTPQGLMFSFLGLLILRPRYSTATKAILISLSCAANPALIAIIVAGYAALFFMKRVDWKDIVAVSAGILLLAPWVFWGWSETGEVIWTLSTNGSANLFLGNNPHPLSYRAAGDLDEVVTRWSLPGTASYTDAVLEYWKREPVDFVTNLAYKFIHFPLPTDHLWSVEGSWKMGLAAVFVGVTQVMIYLAFVYRAWTHPVTKSIMIALALFLATWLFHTVFFVKVRYRIPFDVLLLLAIFADRDIHSTSSATDDALR